MKQQSGIAENLTCRAIATCRGGVKRRWERRRELLADSCPVLFYGACPVLFTGPAPCYLRGLPRVIYGVIRMEFFQFAGEMGSACACRVVASERSPVPHAADGVAPDAPGNVRNGTFQTATATVALPETALPRRLVSATCRGVTQ